MEVNTTQVVSLEIGDVKLVQGPKGDKGDRGEQGAPGPGLEITWRGTELGTRIAGEINYSYVDLKGDTGAQGPMGPTGEAGPQGPQGIQGPRGEKGERGINGVAVSAEGLFAFNVNEEGHLILSYTGDISPTAEIRENGHLYLTI